jgi:hypothetical protein
MLGFPAVIAADLRQMSVEIYAWLRVIPMYGT